MQMTDQLPSCPPFKLPPRSKPLVATPKRATAVMRRASYLQIASASSHKGATTMTVPGPFGRGRPKRTKTRKIFLRSKMIRTPEDSLWKLVAVFKMELCGPKSR
ncbi:hypothetical protein AcW1_003812 [Taiwanofungus camphoratus]|nr:hypothetical protein AcW1_003812 [Antrodia cinnamomea]